MFKGVCSHCRRFISKARESKNRKSQKEAFQRILCSNDDDDDDDVYLSDDGL